MTTFERDMKEVKEGFGTEVMKRRKAELDRLIAQGRACKNNFRCMCIAQQVVKLTAEYNALDAAI